MKYAILHKAMTKCKLPYPVTAGSYGLVRSFGTQRDAYLYAQKIFGSQFDVMGVEIVEINEAVKHMAVHCEVNSGRRNDAGHIIDTDKASYKEMYSGFVDGYKREIRCRREVAEREVARVKAAKARKFNTVNPRVAQPTKPTKPATVTDRAMRLEIYKETGEYVKPVQGIKPLEMEF